MGEIFITACGDDTSGTHVSPFHDLTKLGSRSQVGWFSMASQRDDAKEFVNDIMRNDSCQLCCPVLFCFALTCAFWFLCFDALMRLTSRVFQSVLRYDCYARHRDTELPYDSSEIWRLVNTRGWVTSIPVWRDTLCSGTLFRADLWSAATAPVCRSTMTLALDLGHAPTVTADMGFPYPNPCQNPYLV